MKTIGLIGGMSWESTAVTYRLLNEMVRDRLGGLHSAEIVLRSVDFARIAALQTAGRWDLAAGSLADAARALEKAGADCVLICTNTMHLVADTVAAAVSIPLIHIVDETAAALVEGGRRKPLLLATRYTMEHGFYAQRMARHGLEVMVPEAEDRALVHGVIFEELCRGIVRPESRVAVQAVVEAGRRAGADSVILGCTEICLLLDPAAQVLPGFDSTEIHARAAIRFAFGEAIRNAA